MWNPGTQEIPCLLLQFAPRFVILECLIVPFEPHSPFLALPGSS